MHTLSRDDFSKKSKRILRDISKSYHEESGRGCESDASLDILVDHSVVEIMGETHGGEGVAFDVCDVLFHWPLVEKAHE